jgi:hypothetical protein
VRWQSTAATALWLPAINDFASSVRSLRSFAPALRSLSTVALLAKEGASDGGGAKSPLRHPIVTRRQFENLLNHPYIPADLKAMKAFSGQLELELRTSEQCRSVRRSRKPGRSRVWFEKMRQVVDDAADRQPDSSQSSPSAQSIK